MMRNPNSTKPILSLNWPPRPKASGLREAEQAVQAVAERKPQPDQPAKDGKPR
jgi:hypothetical protein